MRGGLQATRRKERKRAFQALYSLVFARTRDIDAVAHALMDIPVEEEAGSAVDDKDSYARRLAEGVWRNEAVLDKGIERFSRNWRTERMGKIELVLLRLALYEFLAGLAPPGAAIREAVALADCFGAGDAKNFICGVLDAAIKAVHAREYPDDLKISSPDGEL